MLIAGTSLLIILPAVCFGLILTASLHDIVTRTIPHSLVLALALVGIATGATGGYLFGSLLAAGSIFVVSALCWRRGWMGGGDVKLLGVAALAIPPSSVLTFVAAVTIAGALLALLYLAARPLVRVPMPVRPNGLLARAVRVERWRIRRGGPLPYACAIATGFLFVIV